MFKSIGIIAKPGHQGVTKTLHTLLHYLRRKQLHLLMDESSTPALPEHGLPSADLNEIGKRCKLAIVVGGDGSLLRAARVLAAYDIYLLGINQGRLGFLADLNPTDMEMHLDAILSGQYIEEKRFLLHAAVWRGGQQICQGNALNDVLVHKWNNTHMIGFDVHINQHFLSGQRSDGLIIATPTGSTAYSRAGGGPILHPSLNAISMVSIFPHTLINPPIVIDGDSQIKLTLHAQQEGQAQVSCDGEPSCLLEPEDQIKITKHRDLIHLLHPLQHDYYATLRNKLHLGKGP